MLEELLEKLNQINNLEELENLRIKVLGRNGIINQEFKKMKDLPIEEKKEFGKKLNQFKEKFEKLLEEKKEILLREKISKEEFKKFEQELNLPGKFNRYGVEHLVKKTLNEIINIFKEEGFKVVEGPDIEEEFYNFDALNIPKEHPARAMQDTFYLENGKLLRTHTSNTQIHVMRNYSPPIKIVAPGLCYRKDEIDATHFPMFHQLEILCVDKDITFNDLVGTLKMFTKKFFGTENIRLRSSYFPFTEPSLEVDVECFFCNGKGCKICKNTGYIELGGAGMVHPKVLENCGLDPNKWRGFAAGMGIERFTMLKYKITDIRYFFNNDIRLSGK